MSRPCWVYRVYDAGGTLLYVGSTVALEPRLKYHAAHSPWWPFRAAIKAKVYNELEARRQERDAINNEHPRWNTKDRSPEHPDGPCRLGAINAPHLHEEVQLWRAWLKATADHRRAQNKLAALTERMAQIVEDRASQPTVRERKAAALRNLSEPVA